jgi:hypothetical protein
MNHLKKVVNISDVVENQIPEFILTENPNFSEFLKQYYISQEYQGGPTNISENLSNYKNIDSFDITNLISDTTLSEDVFSFDDEIFVDSTNGWPNSYGLLKINDEIITYTGITTNSFTGCIRGFSGIESLSQENNPEVLVFSTTESTDHNSGDIVYNLSNLFLQEFFNKIKYHFTPGFEEIEFDPKINPQNFISKAKTFYQSKGADESYKILFKVLFNEDVSIIKPKDLCFTPSDDKWIVTETFVCEAIQGDPYLIKGQTLYQDIDENNQVLPATGSIYEVESFQLDDKLLYKIKIFSGYSNNLNPKGSISGTFIPTSKTTVISDVVLEDNTIFVDSTVGFVKEGYIEIDGIDYYYTDKTVNQFLNVSGISSSTNIKKGFEVNSKNYTFSYENGDITKVVKLRIFNILSDIETKDSLYALEGDPIIVASIGNVQTNPFNKSLTFNLPLTINAGIATLSITPTIRNYFKKGFSISNGLALTKTSHNLNYNDSVNLYTKADNNLIKSNLSVTTNLSKEFTVESIEDTSILGKEVIFRRNVKKSKAIPFSRYYTDINDRYSANIQDSYSDDNYYYLATNGFPDYQINPYERRFELTVSDISKLSGFHNFYTGEEVTVVGYTLEGNFKNTIGIQTGNSYYITRTNSTELKISESRENVGLSSYIQLIEFNEFGFVSGQVKSIDMVISSVYGNKITSSKLLKKIPKVQQLPTSKETIQPGPIGIFANGVEIQSYKSFDKLYYGPIENIILLNGGEGYNLITPPEFKITGNGIVDTKTKLICSMKGTLKSIVVKNPGFDYEDTPIVTITGGNNSEVITDVKMKNVSNEVQFNATTKDTVVNTINHELRFGFPHGFVTGEPILYQTFGTKAIGIGTQVSDGTLLNNSVYYAVNVGTGTSIRLAPSKTESLLGQNLIEFRTTGGGIQSFKSLNKIQVIDNVSIISNNLEFEYKRRSFGDADINTYNDTFNCIDHGFKTGEAVIITQNGTPLEGPIPGKTYYIVKIDDNSFKLSKTKETIDYLNIDGIDFATTYYVEYEPITVSIDGRIKKNGSSIPGYGATLIPIVEGSVEDVRVQRGLSSPPEQYFGSKNIINYNDAPLVTLYTGYDASLYPSVINGKINQVIVKSSGYEYYNNIDLVVKGVGYGAKLLPVIEDGRIIDVNIISGGVGYAATNTTIEIVSVGKNLKVKAELKSWTLNEVTKLGINNLSKGNLFGKRYSIFGNVYGTFFLDLNLRNTFNISTFPDVHSPIVGWAYDGCPIYGPFAYENVDGSGAIIRMRSGYSRNKISPSSSIDCDEDYIFTNSGTLDEYNGRYCRTPEYPKGIYAYFCTLNESNSPEFPYVIGKQYNYAAQKENFDLKFNQTLDINSLNIIKDTNHYRVEDLDDRYEYFKLYSNTKEDATVLSSTTGKVTKIDVIDGGENYEVGDKIIFNNEFTDGSGAYGQVVEVGGVGVSSISKSTLSISGVSLSSINEGILGISTQLNLLSNNDFITVSGVSTTDYAFLEKYYNISIEKTLQTNLTNSLPDGPTTGVVTSIKVTESLFKFEIDDKLQIENEILTIIGIDLSNNNINVLRNVSSPSHGVGTTVFLQNNKFILNGEGNNISLPEKNSSYYFNPTQQIPIGVSTAIGSGSVVYNLPLGAGTSTTKFVPNGTIYLPNHKFKTGDKIIYTYDNSSIVTNFGNLNSISEIYAIKISNDTIGLVTNKLYLGNTDNLILYTSPGTGILHKFETDRGTITCDVTRNTITVNTGSVGIGSTVPQIAHNLIKGDIVSIKVKSKNEVNYSVGYSTITKRLSVNYEVNPKIFAIESETLIFDLTSPDLAGCSFDIYTDKNFNNKYYGNNIEGLEVTKDINQLKLRITDNTPRILYYNLTSESKEIYSDLNVYDHNIISIVPSKYNITTNVLEKTDYTFTVSLQDIPEKDYYNSIDSDISYSILSPNIKGSIVKADILFSGSNYKKLPKINSIISTVGSGANLIPSTNSIGNIKNIKILNNTSIFPTDKTLAPVSYLYSAIKLYDNYLVGDVEIISSGSNYLSSPDLILYNSKEDKILDNFDAVANIKNTCIDSVKILNPGSGLKSSDNQIICINNTNGYNVLEASVFPGIPYIIDLRLETPIAGFSTSNDLNMEVGDKIFIENIKSDLGNGYNSSDHKYKTFEITYVDKAYGSQDAAIVRYELETYPGIFNLENTYNATIINEKNIAVIKPILVENVFSNGEEVLNTTILNNENNSPITSLLKVYDSSKFLPGQVVTGKYSNSKGKVFEISYYPKSNTSSFKVDSSVSESAGWKDYRGNLSSILQKLPDNDYYQSFSYSLKSKKSYTEWNSIVSDLSHVAGYKKFSDMIIESTSSNPVGITSDSSSILNVIITSHSDANSISNFDLVYEEDIDDNDGEYSEYLKFSSKTLSNYLLSIENKVLPIDDISSLFDTDNSPVVTVPIDTINSAESTVLKYYIFIASTKSFFGDFLVPQVLELLVTRLDNTVYLTSYGWYWDNSGNSGSKLPIGEITGQLGTTNNDEIVINFVPRNIFNSYSIRAVKEVTSTTVGIASTSIGYIDSIEQSSGISTSIPQTLLSVPTSDCTSGVLFFGISDSSKNIKNALELSFIRNGSDIQINQYTEFEPLDIGEISVENIGSNINFIFTGVAGIAVTVFTNYTLFTNTLSSPTEIVRDLSRISSNRISHMGTSPVGISTVSTLYAATKYVIQIDKIVGVTTQKSLIQINTVHFEGYSNNVEFGVVGTIPNDEIVFETIFDEILQTYTLTFNPVVDATYQFTVYEKNIVSPNQQL